MNWLALRGDLRIIVRPALLLLMVGLAVLAGLLSVVAQNTQHSQYVNAQTQIEKKAWLSDVCGGTKAACVALGEKDAKDFLEVQTSGAKRIGELQNVGGAIKYGAAFMALASGALFLVVIGTSLIGAEWRRGTMQWSIGSDFSENEVARRRLLASVLVGLMEFILVVVVLTIVGRIGAQNWPLPGDNPSVLLPIAGVLLMISIYSGLASWFGWKTRDALATLAYSLFLVGVVAVSTPISRWSPGTAVASLVQVHTLSEPEIGYLWIWPEITFTRAGFADRIVESPPWPVAAVGALLVLLALLLFVNRAAQSRHLPE